MKKKSIITQSLMTAFFVFYFAPLELYLSNKSEFFFSIYELIPALSIGFVGALAGFIFVGLVLNRINTKLCECIFATIHVISLGLYIQGNFVIARYGSLDGTPIDWSRYGLEAGLSVLLWILAIIYGVVLAFKLKVELSNKFIQVLSLIVFLTQLVTLSTLLLSSNAFTKGVVSIPTKDNEFNMSKSDNMIILIVDSMDSRALNQIITEDLDNRYSDILENFTYYRNTAGVYLYTELGVPYILSGIEYDDSETYNTYLGKVYGENSFLHDVSSKGYLIDAYLKCDTPIGETGVQVENFEEVQLTVSSHRTLIKYMYKLLGFKYLPFHLKQLCWFYPEEMDCMKITSGNDVAAYDWDNYEFYDELSTMTIGQESPVLHIYHIKGPHVPYSMTADFTESDTETSIYDETRGMLVLLDKFISILKENEIYEKTPIVILADHGVIGERQSPTLLIKESNSKHKFVIDDSAISYNALRGLFNDLVEKKTIYIDEYIQNERFFYMHKRDYSRNVDTQRFNLTRCKVGRDSFDDMGVSIEEE